MSVPKRPIAVRATRLGAFDFLEKPLSLDKILPILEQAKNTKHAHGGAAGDDAPSMIGESEAILELKKLLKKISEFFRPRLN